MKASDIKKVLVIGSGTMGRQIGLQNALFGRDVTFYDLNEEILKVALTHIGQDCVGPCQERVYIRRDGGISPSPDQCQHRHGEGLGGRESGQRIRS